MNHPSAIAAMVMVSCLISGCGETATSGPAGPISETQKIQRLIGLLGDDDFATRESATKKLIEIGEPAVPELKEAFSNFKTEPEIAWRARAIVAKLEIQKKLAEKAENIPPGKISFADAINFIRTKAKLDIHVHLADLTKGGFLKPGGTNQVSLSGKTWKDCFESILNDLAGGDSTKLDYAICDGVIEISTREYIAKKPKRFYLDDNFRISTTPYVIRLVRYKLLEPINNVSLNDIDFCDAIEFLRTRTDMNYEIRWPVLTNEGVGKEAKINIQLQHVTAVKFLELMLDQVSENNNANVMFSIIDGYIVISTREDLSKETIRSLYDIKMDRDTPENRKVLEKLKTLLKRVPLTGVAFSDGLKFVEERTDIKIDIDWNAFEKAGIGQDKQLTISLANVSVKNCLLSILNDVCGGTETETECIIKDGKLVIYPKDNQKSE